MREVVGALDHPPRRARPAERGGVGLGLAAEVTLGIVVVVVVGIFVVGGDCWGVVGLRGGDRRRRDYRGIGIGIARDGRVYVVDVVRGAPHAGGPIAYPPDADAPVEEEAGRADVPGGYDAGRAVDVLPASGPELHRVAGVRIISVGGLAVRVEGEDWDRAEREEDEDDDEEEEMQEEGGHSRRRRKRVGTAVADTTTASWSSQQSLATG